MIKKIAIGLIVLLLAFVALYTTLNVLYNRNSEPAEQIVDLIESRAAGYISAAQYGTFDYDTEQSVLNENIRKYKELNNWFIRPHVEAQYVEAVAEAERALASAREFQEGAAETQAAGEDAARRAMEEMIENQRRAAESP